MTDATGGQRAFRHTSSVFKGLENDGFVESHQAGVVGSGPRVRRANGVLQLVRVSGGALSLRKRLGG
jgi:hypothetical protein